MGILLKVRFRAVVVLLLAASILLAPWAMPAIEGSHGTDLVGLLTIASAVPDRDAYADHDHESGHLKDHNQLDHSHDAPSAAQWWRPVDPSPSGEWDPQVGGIGKFGHRFRLERPPRLIFTA
jgi:hypothetical protein